MAVTSAEVRRAEGPTRRRPPVTFTTIPTSSRTSGEQRESAVEARDRVAGQMLPHEIAEAQRLAREWDAAHPREP